MDSRFRGNDATTIGHMIAMKASLSTKLTQLAARLHELDGLLAAEDVTRDLDRFRALSREHSEITPVVTLYRDWQKADNDLAAAQDMLADPEMKAFGDEEAKAAKVRMEALEAQLQSVLLPRDPERRTQYLRRNSRRHRRRRIRIVRRRPPADVRALRGTQQVEGRDHFRKPRATWAATRK